MGRITGRWVGLVGWTVGRSRGRVGDTGLVPVINIKQPSCHETDVLSVFVCYDVLVLL